MTDNPPAGIHPLRERLATLYLDREYDGGHDYRPLSRAHPEVQAACYESADATLPVLASWLREEAAELRRDAAAVFDISLDFQAHALEVRADAIDPKEARDGQ